MKKHLSFPLMLLMLAAALSGCIWYGPHGYGHQGYGGGYGGGYDRPPPPPPPGYGGGYHPGY